MAYNPNKELKLYYSIGEVAKMFDVNESLLRYWEKEFPIISPKRVRKFVAHACIPITICCLPAKTDLPP